MNCEMNQNNLMCMIMQYDFAIYDLVLYLDTHPEDSEAIGIYMSLKAECKKLTKEYVRLYGPIKNKQVTNENYWTWVSTPWPWEGVC